MTDWIMGLSAFLLFFLYDWNRVFVKKSWMKPFFAMGNLLLAAVALRLLWAAVFLKAERELPWLMGSALFLALLIYTLYFALPFDSTYCREADTHKVCQNGLYGLCRHPGIWWFFGFFACLGMAAGEKLGLCFCLSFLNLLYAAYQDKFIFVTEFSDYQDYRRKVPFLIPRIWKKEALKNEL